MPLRKDIQKVLVIGSGPIVIGQAAEFDYAGTQACLALKEEGIEVVLLNSNPATIMTDQSIADRVYIEPLTVETIEEIIKKEKPDGIIGTLGGQTGLNLAVQLDEMNILTKYGVEMLGTSVDSIQNGEDRERFRSLMLKIEEPIPESKIIRSFEEGKAFVEEIGYPVIIRPAYTLGGAGGGFAYDDTEFETILKRGLKLSPIHQVLVEKSIRGWKEVEYEVMRDANDTCIIVCNMENMDPVGVHTGDSIVVAPSQTLSDVQYQILRQSSLKVIRSLEIIGGCNIQFALDPTSNHYYIIEVNPRVSRSSALASKATGYPIARMAAKCAIGYNLDEILNPITGNTYASFEPALDYIVVKLPRFPFDKFPEADRSLGTQMKATGEVMAIDRTFEGALNKGLRSLELNLSGLYYPKFATSSLEELKKHLLSATDLRLFAIAHALRLGITIDELSEWTAIDKWFLNKLQGLIKLEETISNYTLNQLPLDLLLDAKLKNISDKRISECLGTTEKAIRDHRKQFGLSPAYKLVDTCAGEFDAETPYYYSTWQGADEVEVSNKKKVLVIGSGPIRIGQGIEFDYCSVHAALALKKKGYEAIVMNNNPETVSTDFSIADKLYFEPLAIEDILHVIDKEKVDGVLVQFGGQTALNVAEELQNEGITILGTSVESIDYLEDRDHFYQLLNGLDIPHIKGEMVYDPKLLKETAEKLGFPILVRPSYVIGGQSMVIFYKKEDLDEYVNNLDLTNKRILPLLVDQYLPGLECEIDVISDGTDIVIPGIFEHVERAGVHSGDSVTVFPPLSMTTSQKEKITQYTKQICLDANIIGIANIQFVVMGEEIYVLEVNARASRTVPILSKVTGIPMIEWATLVQLGEKLNSLTTGYGLLAEPNYYVVKAPVFSAEKLKDVDHILSPEMKSTGEVLGLAETVEEALEKAMFHGKQNPFHKNSKKGFIFCSFTDREKENTLPILADLVKDGFQLVATGGTANYLQEHGFNVKSLSKDKDEIRNFFKEQFISATISLPTQGRNKLTTGAFIRELATSYSVSCFTNLDTVKSAVYLQTNNTWCFRTIDEYKQIGYSKKGVV